MTVACQSAGDGSDRSAGVGTTDEGASLRMALLRFGFAMTVRDVGVALEPVRQHAEQAIGGSAAFGGMTCRAPKEPRPATLFVRMLHGERIYRIAAHVQN